MSLVEYNHQNRLKLIQSENENENENEKLQGILSSSFSIK
jgi:hypothetical protein